MGFPAWGWISKFPEGDATIAAENPRAIRAAVSRSRADPCEEAESASMARRGRATAAMIPVAIVTSVSVNAAHRRGRA